MKLSNQSGEKPLWSQLYDLLEKRILEGEYKEGSLMPPETVLMEEFGVSRVTVRQAMEKLMNSNLIIRKRGKGTFVLKRENKLATTFQSSFFGVREENNKNDRRVICVSYEKPPIEAAYFFGITEDTKVLRVVRETYANGKPMTYYESYLNPIVGLDENTDFSESMYQKLESVNFPITQVKEKITAKMMNKSEKEIFELTGQHAVMDRIRMGSSKDTPVEYTISKYVAEGYELTINLK